MTCTYTDVCCVDGCMMVVLVAAFTFARALALTFALAKCTTTSRQAQRSICVSKADPINHKTA